MEESLDREIRRAAREGYGLGILLADLDNFKQLNEHVRHAAGDTVLRRIGRFLAGAVRSEDIACRFGGEGVRGDPAQGVAGRRVSPAEALREGIKAGSLDEPDPFSPTRPCPVGGGAYPEHGTSAAQLILAADSAMYLAKAQGRDRVIVAADRRAVPSTRPSNRPSCHGRAVPSPSER